MRQALVGAGWAWAAAIVWLSLTPSPPDIEFQHGDKFGHFAAYGVLMFWFAQLYRVRVFYAIGFVAMGLALEFAQDALGYRSYELSDMGANTLGVLAGWAAALALSRPVFP
jgi:VanZ family protein